MAVLLSLTMLFSLSSAAYAEEDKQTTELSNINGPSVYLSRSDKLEFADQMSSVYAQKLLLNEVKVPTRDLIDNLLLQVSIASPAEQKQINAELESYGVYKFDCPVIERTTTRTGTGDVTLAAPVIYYEAWNNCWSVTCGGEWNNTNYGGYINDVGGDDGFGVGYTNSSNPYKSSVVSCSAYLTDANNRYYESTSNRSDGDGSKGFGFRLQDGWQNIGNYVGHKWSGVCTYDNWFGNYNGVATAYYIHTYNEANLKSVTFGKNGTTAGIEANIEAVESSFTAFSNDTVFGTYP